MTVSAWTDDRVGRLKTLWIEGRSAAEIARDLDHGLTRSAVLGKVHRLGLSAGRPPAFRSARAAAGPAARRPPPARASPAPRPEPLHRSAMDAPSHGTATILSARRQDCRWPYGDPGDPGFALCGRAVARGAFCAAHAEIGYRPIGQNVEGLMALAGLA
ncbi:MAG: GcrA family cell cycle regulator [Brevundimonas sp.]|uniref:GcrA family cell cycle regulator n=1 Tax=Brevundimonas sp. TaxID=1871086 RepID=UPI002487A85B|nr:GcrA family cell cycle regulator [Brevundimonas sp.]MDI1326987.1 GcrA family cell cycle regulator [Brevundimonas sp.]